MLARHRRVRPWRALVYFLQALGGIVIWIDPSRNVEPLPTGLRWVWGSFVVVGGLGAMLGTVRDKWLYEFVALPMVSMGFVAYIVVLCAGVGTGRLAIAAWLASIVVHDMHRWFGLWKFVSTLKRAKRRRETPDA